MLTKRSQFSLPSLLIFCLDSSLYISSGSLKLLYMPSFLHSFFIFLCPECANASAINPWLLTEYEVTWLASTNGTNLWCWIFICCRRISSSSFWVSIKSWKANPEECSSYPLHSSSPENYIESFSASLTSFSKAQWSIANVWFVEQNFCLRKTIAENRFSG